MPFQLANIRLPFVKKLVLLFLLVVLAAVLAWRFFPRDEQPLAIAPAYRDLKLAEARQVQLRIGSGDFFATVLVRAGVTAPEAARLIADLAPVYNLAQIRSGALLTLFFENDRLRNLVYEVDRDRFLQAERKGPDRFQGRMAAVPYETKRQVIRIRIENSLYESTTACGERMELFEPLARIFECEVDFNRDIQPGDMLTAVLEKKYLNGRLAAYGDILAAELINNGRTIRIVRFASPEGVMSYFHPDGRSTRRQFLRCPLPFIRVSSRFGMRQHPVLGLSARHNGTDFAAPYGTLVRATAAGVVTARGRDNGRGNFVSIRHANGFVSHYYHLQRFAAGLRGGQRVEQGQAIGAVGSTGLSTGPHLHYGLQKNGRFLNPLRLQSPSVASLPAEILESFRVYCEQVCLPLARPPQTGLGKAPVGKSRPLPRLQPFTKGSAD